MNHLNQLGATASYELLKLSRRGKVKAAIAWTTLILGSSAAIILMGYASFANPEAFLNWILQPSLFMLYLSIAACVLAGDAVASELEHKTCFIGFTNPVRRSTLLIGKYLACMAVLIGVLTAYFLASSAAVYSMFGVIPSQILLAYLYALAIGAAMLGVVFVFSTIMKGTSATITSLLVLTFAFQILVIVMFIFGVEPWFILNYAAIIINAAIQPITGGPHMLLSVAVIGAYIAVTLGASIILLNRKEFS